MKTFKLHQFRQILAATLALSSSFGMISPVLAQVASGTAIKNTATATFSDGTTTYNATSNEVVITVAEVAGVTITPNAPSVTAPNAGDTLFVDYIITNTGNDPTQFFIPGNATLSNTTAFSQNGPLQIVAVNGTSITAKDVPAGGAATGDAALLGPTDGSIAPNPGTGTTGTITVRVPIKVSPGATAGQSLTVSLGETNPVNGQNQDRTGANVGAKDVYTVDNPNGQGGETNATAPVNGVREAMNTSSTITVNARQQAFSTVLKAVSGYSLGTNANDISDDVLTYALALKVENPSTLPTGLIASDLYGTTIIGLDPLKAYVLVSDAIPTGMKLGTANPVSPSGWQVVYSTSPLTQNALQASWSTTLPASGITRIGFVKEAIDAATAIPKGTTVSGFSFTVTPDTGFTGGQIANIAQTFGQSQPGAVVAGTATQIVYDESGDQTYNNGLDGADPDPSGASGASGGITDGKADPAADGTDPGTGTNPTAADTNIGTDTNNGTKTKGGEDTVYVIAATPLNGPKDQPGATGPTDTNDDFTNKSIVVPASKNPADILTDAETIPVTFENTVQNTSGGSQVISLLPTSPAPGDLIDNTKVTITDPVSGNTATYNYTAATGFSFTSGTGTVAGNPIGATNPIKVTVSAGGTANYTVTVDLPDAPQLKGYPVPITAFVDVNNDGLPTGEPSNITIDRVYTNYLELKKEARILEADGITEVVGFTTIQATLSAAATPGRVIEYRVTYTNISTSAGSGTNNVILPANNLVITENGSTGNNTWFALTLDPKYPTSANGTATNTGGGTIAVTTAQNGTVTDIQIYTNTVTTVAPTGTGTFTFQRKIK